MTQQEIAKKLGVQQSTISRWLSGTVRPKGAAKAALKEQFPTLYQQIKKIYEVKHGTNS